MRGARPVAATACRASRSDIAQSMTMWIPRCAMQAQGREGATGSTQRMARMGAIHRFLYSDGGSLIVIAVLLSTSTIVCLRDRPSFGSLPPVIFSSI